MVRFYRDMSNTALSREKIMLTPVASILDTNAIILEGDRYLDEGLRMMQERNSRCILVSHLGEVMGLISETDILFKVAQENRSPHKVKLREIMTTPVVAVHTQTTFEQALAIMSRRKVRQLMVHAYSAVLGIVTKDDLINKINSLMSQLESSRQVK